MPHFTPEDINRIIDFESLLAFLHDNLDWPVDSSKTIEEVTFDFTADELRVHEAAAARLHGGMVRQLRDFRTDQKIGIFFVEFDDANVYATSLRQILRGLVPNRRQSGQQRTWEHENILFVCATRNYEQFTFAHFSGDKHATAKLSMFGWQRGDTHLRTLCEFNLRALEWPSDPTDADAWLKKWSSAFDVEKVTDRFFEAYREVFEAAEREVKKSIKDAETARLFTQRLFNRLMFIYFIQKKGWLSFNGDQKYLRALFNAAEAKKENFFRDRLYWLFFWGMSNVGESREVHDAEFLKERRGEVPYLNGGLFDIEDEYDGDRDAVRISNKAFAGILDLFEQYNFTVEESTPLDVQVAVDPEMLGKVFEELVTGRHTTGSYYTPRPIVSFMCREALKHYLSSVQPNKEIISKFVDEEDASDLQNPESVLEALKRVRICDPACGSGAYLLGMMHELTRLRTSLFKSKKIGEAALYDQKRSIIEKNLYGVDNDKFATQITCLRLWLSLAIESNEPHPLPNLDFKIECGDSLTGPAPSEAEKQMTFARAALVSDFRQAKGEYMRETDPDQKRQLRQGIEDLRLEIALALKHQSLSLSKSQVQKKRDELTAIERSISSARNATIKTQLKKQAENIQKTLVANETAPNERDAGFDWAVEFAEVFTPPVAERWRINDLHPMLNDFKHQSTLIEEVKPEPGSGGFDIILANPPYVSFGLRGNKAAKSIWASLMRALYPNSAEYKISLYAIFIDRGLQLCRTGGNLVYITPDSFLLGRYFSKLRSRILESCHIDLICMFEADFWKAGVVGRPTILKVSNEKNDQPAQIRLFKNLEELEQGGGLVETYSQRQFELVPHKRFRLFFSKKAITFVDRIEDGSIPLGSLAKITTGVRSKIGQERIVATEPKTNKWKKGIQSGGQVKPFQIDYQGHYLNIDGDLLWAGGWNAQIEENPKLMIRQTGDSLIVAIDRQGLYHLNNVHSLSITDGRVSLEYIAALLNSRLMNRYYHLISLERHRAMAQTDIETLETLPIKIPTKTQQDEVCRLVLKILNGEEAALPLLEEAVIRVYSLEPILCAYLAGDELY